MPQHTTRSGIVDAVRWQPDQSNTIEILTQYLPRVRLYRADGPYPVIGLAGATLFPGNWLVDDEGRLAAYSHDEFQTAFEPIGGGP